MLFLAFHEFRERKDVRHGDGPVTEEKKKQNERKNEIRL